MEASSGIFLWQTSGFGQTVLGVLYQKSNVCLFEISSVVWNLSKYSANGDNIVKYAL